ncbi:DUF3180 domain-containing protein [Luteococcus peritonei]|uniref:DUF3180 domain-containing protein n=1 Tax=Luteococcus peritonei TaxID=88874 RepID=A0ABW4RUW1_9ACTN
MSQPATPGGGRLGLTTRRQVVVAALLGAVVGYFVIGTLRARDISVPPSPWSLMVTLVLLAAAALMIAPVLRRRILTERSLVSPETGLLALVSGKSLLMMGAALAGGHVVYVLATLDSLHVPISRERAIRGAVVLALSLGVGWAGSRLEKACVVPGDDHENDDEPKQD